MQQIEFLQIVVLDVSRAVIAQKMIQLRHRIRQVTIANSIHNIDAFPGVQVVEPQTILFRGRRRCISICCTHRPCEQSSENRGSGEDFLQRHDLFIICARGSSCQAPGFADSTTFEALDEFCACSAQIGFYTQTAIECSVIRNEFQSYVSATWIHRGQCMDRTDRQGAEHLESRQRVAPMDDSGRPFVSQLAFGVVFIGLGVIGLIYRDFAMGWQRIPIQHLPGLQFFAVASAIVELITGLGLLFQRTTKISSRVLFVFLLIWAVLLKIPAVVAAPQIEGTWLGFGEIAVILAGGWILFAANAGGWERTHLKFAVGARGTRIARILFAVSLPMIGLSHFFYTPATVALVPAWLPARVAWAYLTGAGDIVAGIAVLFAIFPRLAATMEAGMLGIITLLVWGPGLVTKPTDRLQITAFLISAVITCGAWIVADSYRGIPWLSIGTAASNPPAN
jgi:uncharacterized membrane protein